MIGPQTKHAYHPATKREIDRKIDSLATKGRDRSPREVAIVTYTLKYNTMHWASITAMGEHWKRASLSASIAADGSEINVVTNENVDAFALDFPAGYAPLGVEQILVVNVNGAIATGAVVGTDRSMQVNLTRMGKSWQLTDSTTPAMGKRHDLQGPIDDAFMDSFIIVRPTGKSSHAKVQTWVDAELSRAIEHWRRHFRGEARVVNDNDLTPEQIASANLILWGDPSSNAVLAKIAAKLPIHWSGESIDITGQTYPATDNALIMICPNPLNPRKYVVLNSGFTFRDYDYLNNARQVPKLPDWAVIDLNTPPNSRTPGKVIAADFFNEEWKLKSSR